MGMVVPIDYLGFCGSCHGMSHPALGRYARCDSLGLGQWKQRTSYLETLPKNQHLMLHPSGIAQSQS